MVQVFAEIPPFWDEMSLTRRPTARSVGGIVCSRSSYIFYIGVFKTPLYTISSYQKNFCHLYSSSIPIWDYSKSLIERERDCELWGSCSEEERELVWEGKRCSAAGEPPQGGQGWLSIPECEENKRNCVQKAPLHEVLKVGTEQLMIFHLIHGEKTQWYSRSTKSSIQN